MSCSACTEFAQNSDERVNSQWQPLSYVQNPMHMGPKCLLGSCVLDRPACSHRALPLAGRSVQLLKVCKQVFEIQVQMSALRGCVSHLFSNPETITEKQALLQLFMYCTLEKMLDAGGQ